MLRYETRAPRTQPLAVIDLLLTDLFPTGQETRAALRTRFLCAVAKAGRGTCPQRRTPGARLPGQKSQPLPASCPSHRLLLQGDFSLRVLAGAALADREVPFTGTCKSPG